MSGPSVVDNALPSVDRILCASGRSSICGCCPEPVRRTDPGLGVFSPSIALIAGMSEADGVMCIDRELC